MASRETSKSCISARHSTVANRHPPRPPFKWFPYYKDVCSLSHPLFSAHKYFSFLSPCLRIMAPKAHLNFSHPGHAIMASSNMWTILACSWLVHMWSEPVPDIGCFPRFSCFPPFVFEQ